ncbi:MAG: ornithine carbamoyltransferase [Candidatus Omnitrophota bacterium]
MKKNLLTLHDVSLKEIAHIFDLARKMKKNKGRFDHHLKGKTIALLFQKPSNRTRVSFEVGIWQLGGNCLYLGPDEIDLGKRESTSDVAKTLSRYLDGIVARTHLHQDIVELGKNATIPIINGLSDQFHPCQALTDIFSIQEKFGTLKGITLAYVGDGNNVCRSLMLGAAKVGLNMNIASPQGYEPADDIVEIIKPIAQKTKAKITITNSPQEAIRGAQVVYADVWVSMGQEKESAERLKKFRDFQINSALVKSADADYVFMHCLPAHRGFEVTTEVIDSPHSIIFEQAENRLHVQKAILIFLYSNKKI